MLVVMVVLSLLNTISEMFNNASCYEECHITKEQNDQNTKQCIMMCLTDELGYVKEKHFEYKRCGDEGKLKILAYMILKRHRQCAIMLLRTIKLIFGELDDYESSSKHGRKLRKRFTMEVAKRMRIQLTDEERAVYFYVCFYNKKGNYSGRY